MAFPPPGSFYNHHVNPSSFLKSVTFLSAICLLSQIKLVSTFSFLSNRDSSRSSVLPPSLTCGVAEFSCGETCIPSSWKCDLNPDCKDGSDEKDCPKPAECNGEEFKCSNGKCIPDMWICDAEDDCGDRSDESNCSRVCSADEFSCLTVHACISKSSVCNQIYDCPDGSDEQNCKHECSSAEFDCGDGKCIDKLFRCDQDFDCRDRSDELNCPQTVCDANQFTCGDGKCIPDLWKCDGTTDCKDETDELNCTTLPNHTFCNDKSFRCLDGLECIHIDWKCDGHDDCKDGSDEKGCVYNTTCRADQFRCVSKGICIPAAMRCNGDYECDDKSDETDCDNHSNHNGVTCKSGEFQCNTSKVCIPKEKVCDRDDDCGDWSDEPKSCFINECLTTTHCSHECIDDTIGYHCACPKGLRLGNDKKTCHDIDECNEIFGVCSNHKCINTKGSYKCECLDGYKLVDHRFCRVITKDQPYLVFANRHDIRQAFLPANRSGPQHYAALYRNLSSTVAIDYNLRGNYLIWSDVTEETLFIGKLDKDKDSKYAKKNASALVLDVKNTHGIAIDWIHDLFYWTDDISNTIQVAQVDNPVNRKVLVDSGLDEPRAISIDVKESLLVWADWGDSAFIERSSQDGTNRKKLVQDNIIWPNALTLDIVTKKIYWLDVKLYSLSAINYDGSGRKTLFESKLSILSPFAVDIFEDYLYFSDWKLEAIQRININSEARAVDTFMSQLVENPMGVKIVHNSKQPLIENKCGSAKCSQLCLPSSSQPKKYQCACRDGFVLSTDGSCASRTSLLTKPLITSTTRRQPSSTTTTSPSTLVNNKTEKSSTSSSSTSSPTPSTTSTESDNNSNNNKLDLDEYGSSNHRSEKSKENSFDSFSPSDNVNLVLNSPSYSATDAHLAFIIVAICLTIALFITLLTFIIHRNYAKRSMTSMNFDNPVYRKTTEEQFVLEKSEENVNSSYPSSLEPLNSPGTNEFV